VQRLCRAAGTVQGEHAQRPEAFPQRMACGEVGQFRGDVLMPAQPQIRVDA